MQHHSFFSNCLPVFKSYHLSYCTWDTFDFPNPSSLKDEPAIASLEIFFQYIEIQTGLWGLGEWNERDHFEVKEW